MSSSNTSNAGRSSVSELILFLWEQATDANAQFSVDAVRCWPPGVIDRLLAEKLIVEGSTSKFVACDDCDGSHVEPVEWREPVTELKPYIRCATHGPRPLKLERLQQWKAEPREFAKQTAALLSPNLSKERFSRIQSGRFTEQDRDEILELLTGLPAESKLSKRRKGPRDLDADRLAWTTEGLSPQATLLLRSLWPISGEMLWSNLPNDAFDEGPARNSETEFEGLKRLQKLLSKEYDRLFLVLSVSRKKRTVQLRKDPFNQGGK